MSDIEKKLSLMSNTEIFEYYEKLLVQQDYDFTQDVIGDSTEEISRFYQKTFRLIFKEFQKREIDYSVLLTKGDLPF
jgi:hypothetical protein